MSTKSERRAEKRARKAARRAERKQRKAARRKIAREAFEALDVYGPMVAGLVSTFDPVRGQALGQVLEVVGDLPPAIATLAGQEIEDTLAKAIAELKSSGAPSGAVVLSLEQLRALETILDDLDDVDDYVRALRTGRLADLPPADDPPEA